MKERLKNQKGISLVTLTIAIVILVILGNILIYNVKDNLRVEQLKSMQNDIDNLKDKVSTYYARDWKNTC